MGGSSVQTQGTPLNSGDRSPSSAPATLPLMLQGLVTRVSPQWAEQPTALTNDQFDDVSSYFESFPVSLSLLPTLAPGNVHPDKVLSHQSLPRALLPGESRLNQ